jgi:Spy/CpxP family protein refolding chaperone
MRTLTVALVFSLLLNAALLAGALFGLFAEERAEKDPEAQIAAITDELDLSADQVAGLRDFRQETLDALEARREQGDDGARDELVEMLDDEVYDTARVRQVLNDRAQERNLFWVDVGVRLHAWVATLPEDKQSRFVEMARDKHFFRKLFWGKR